MVSYDRVLPIGSVVLLRGANSRLMIIGYQRMAANKDNKMIYDYCGCPFPEGFVSPEKTAIFNHSSIERVISIGLQNEDYVKVADAIKKSICKRESEKRG